VAFVLSFFRVMAGCPALLHLGRRREILDHPDSLRRFGNTFEKIARAWAATYEEIAPTNDGLTRLHLANG